MSLTSDSRWTEWHLSRLGEGGHLSSAIFNFTLILIAVLMVAMVYRLSYEIQKVRPKQSTFWLKTLFIIIAICGVGVASFPFDRFPIIHNVFGYGMFFAGLLAMLLLKKIAPVFSNKVYTLGYFTVIISSILMFMFFFLGLISLLVVELIGLTFMLLWLGIMAEEINHSYRVAKK